MVNNRCVVAKSWTTAVVGKYGRLPARGECLTDRAASKDGCQGLTEAFTARPRHPSHSSMQNQWVFMLALQLTIRQFVRSKTQG